MSFCDSEVSELTYPLLINLFCTFARGHSAYEQSFMIFLSFPENLKNISSYGLVFQKFLTLGSKLKMSLKNGISLSVESRS